MEPDSASVAPPVPDAAPDDDAGIRPRRPWLAALLNLLAAPLGHVYAGAPWRGLAVAVAATAAGLGALAATMLPLPGVARMTLLAAGLAMRLLPPWDGWRVAAAGRQYRLRAYNRWYAYVAVAVAVVVAGDRLSAAFRARVAAAFRMASPSMHATLFEGEYVMVRPGVSHPVAPGTPVLFRSQHGFVAVARVVGAGGDTLRMRGGTLLRNGAAQREPYAIQTPAGGDTLSLMAWQVEHLADPADSVGYAPTMDDWGPLVVPPGHYFLMGDNRDRSGDSRIMGFTRRRDVVGRPMWIYYSRDAWDGTRWNRLGRAIR